MFRQGDLNTEVCVSFVCLSFYEKRDLNISIVWGEKPTGSNVVGGNQSTVQEGTRTSQGRSCEWRALHWSPESESKKTTQDMYDQRPFEAEGIFYWFLFARWNNFLVLIRAASMIWNILGEQEMV